ncbi:PREDICTED: uncharacterized protein LOC106100654 [Papilio polytes]|uniref:uncharacterized protein LOC106100654 n=1 Tax=Papilio polytes TaxID=76194 RepID=UPI000675BCB1|nr:PREDICTED: uncharacterized protein LOC106100654 [Papilio polytes]
MAQHSENLDFSALFKLDVLVHLDIVNHSFYEVGLKKFLAFSSDKELVFLYINPQLERFDNVYDWDFNDNPVYCMCFEPSGTWLLIVSEQKVLLVPFLPLFTPENLYDCKWSSSRVTVLPLGDIPEPTSVVWWLTKESENIIIIGSKTGVVTFYSLESQTIVGEVKVAGEILELQICFDDSLDLLALLISSGQSQQWKLILEHRSLGYNWLQQTRAQNDREKKDGFMSYIRQLSKDKITFFTQGGSRDDKSQTVEYVLKPVEYLPMFRKGSNNWALTAQYVNGRHFLTAFELNEGTLILESPEDDTPSRTLRPHIKKDGLYIQGLWSQRLIYLLRKNELEVHSANFSVVQGDGLLGAKREFSELWSVELIGDVQRAYLMRARAPPAPSPGWREPTFLCDLQLPRFPVEPCLVVTSCGAYILNTVREPSEWLVSLIMRGGVGAEQSAAALGACVPTLLRAAADLLMSRGKVAPAQYLFSLSQSQPDGWVARLGVFGRLHELSMYKAGSDVQFATLSEKELLEVTSLAAGVGLWALAPLFSVRAGQPHLLLAAVRGVRGARRVQGAQGAQGALCRGALACLLRHACLLPILLEENGQWLFDFITDKCHTFDTKLLKCLCLWMNPLQDQLRAVMRDLKQGITSIYTTRMLQLITTFIRLACVVEARSPCPDIHVELTKSPETWKSQYTPKRSLSCGLNHWALADEGNARVMMTDTPVNTEIIGRVLDVACGRHHTLILTENGLYAAGDNRYGQLGVGRAWAGAGGSVGEAAGAGGALLHVRTPQRAPAAPFAAVAAGHYHSAALDLGGRLYTWGWGVHGQLCLGNIDDQYTPQLVTKFLGRKVQSVGCGASHTVAVMKNGEVWACGAGVFGQLGGGARTKAALPVRVALPDPVTHVAVGYFHTLALTSKGQVWRWGASPQQVRASQARRASSPTPAPSPATAPATDVTPAPAPTPAPAATASPDPHLLPQLVDTRNVRGRIVQLSAGWHHSCILDHTGALYTWGLNFDGQLGSGSRKQVVIPTEVKTRPDPQPEAKGSRSPDSEDNVTKALVACGGDFTIYIDDDGKIYATGNMSKHLINEKPNNRVIMMKTTKRVIKIPASRNSNKFLFQPLDRLDVMFPFDVDLLRRKPIEPAPNPLLNINDFKKKSWPDDVILLLQPWIDQQMLIDNPNMAAKFSYHSKMYSNCLDMLLKSLKSGIPDDQFYITHNEELTAMKKDEMKILITNTISKRIKDISMSILNEEDYPIMENNIYQELPCCCDESSYFNTKPQNITQSENNISIRAANVIDKCISIFPVDNELWEVCFRISKDFYINNNLSIQELEKVLVKYMESHPPTMAAALMYSNDCMQYSKIFSPKFYLNMCSEVLDSWG